MTCSRLIAPAARAALLGALLATLVSPVPAESPQVLWTWSFPPPSVVNDNVETVAGISDLDGDGWPDAIASCADYTLRALSGRPGAPIRLIWTFGATGKLPVGDRTLSLFPDRDADGKPEVVWTTGGGDRAVYLVRGGDGEQLWSYSVVPQGCTSGGTIYQAANVGDLNRDGVPDLAAAVGSNCNRVIALNGVSGSLLWEFPANDGFWSVAAAGDLNGDRTPDVLAGCGGNNLDNRLFLLDGRPSPGSYRAVWEHVPGPKMTSAETVVQDITADGVEDVVAGSYDGTVFAVDGASRGIVTRTVWETAIADGSNVWVSHTLRMPDLDGDCVDDIATATWTPNIRVLSGRTGLPLWPPQPAAPVASYANTAALLPDITGDLQWDLVVGTSVPGYLAAFDGKTGSKLWDWASPQNVKTVAAMGDVTGDGLADILAGLQNAATVYAFSGRNTGGCVRPGGEATGLRVTRLDSERIALAWNASVDPCHGRYRVYAVPSNVNGCFARLTDITALDEDTDPSNASWTGRGDWFGYLVVDETAAGGQGPLGHFRR